MLIELLNILDDLFEQADEQELISKVIGNQQAWEKPEPILQGSQNRQQAA